MNIDESILAHQARCDAMDAIRSAAERCDASALLAATRSALAGPMAGWDRMWGLWSDAMLLVANDRPEAVVSKVAAGIAWKVRELDRVVEIEGERSGMLVRIENMAAHIRQSAGMIVA